MTNTRTPVGLAEALEAIAVDVMVANRIRRDCAVAAAKLREMAAALEPFAELCTAFDFFGIKDDWIIEGAIAAAFGDRRALVSDLCTARRALRGEP